MRRLRSQKKNPTRISAGVDILHHATIIEGDQIIPITDADKVVLGAITQRQIATNNLLPAELILETGLRKAVAVRALILAQAKIKQTMLRSVDLIDQENNAHIIVG